MKHGKKYVDGAKLIERSRLYDTQEALDLCVKTGTAKFDETVEVHVKLGVDGRHADQQVRGAIVLPNGTGKSVRVLVFAKGDSLTWSSTVSSNLAEAVLQISSRPSLGSYSIALSICLALS